MRQLGHDDSGWPPEVWIEAVPLEGADPLVYVRAVNYSDDGVFILGIGVDQLDELIETLQEVAKDPRLLAELGRQAVADLEAWPTEVEMDEMRTTEMELSEQFYAMEHEVTVGSDGYTAACGADVVVDENGYHCTHQRVT